MGDVQTLKEKIRGAVQQRADIPPAQKDQLLTFFGQTTVDEKTHQILINQSGRPDLDRLNRAHGGMLQAWLKEVGKGDFMVNHLNPDQATGEGDTDLNSLNIKLQYAREGYKPVTQI